MATSLETTTTYDVPRWNSDWGAILIGTAIAIAVSTTLLSFGAAIGLTTSSYANWNRSTVIVMLIAVGLWLLLAQVSGLLAGGYFAGRLRARTLTGTPHESDVRDGIHGLAVWGLSVAIVAGATALAAALTAAVGTGAAASLGTSVDRTTMDYNLGMLLRPETAAGATAPAPAPASTADRDTLRTLLGHGLVAPLTPDEKSYASALIARDAGIAQPDAASRLDATMTQLRSAARDAKRAGVLYAFLTAVSLVIGAAAAWWAAVRGGTHRDEATDFSHLVRWQ